VSGLLQSSEVKGQRSCTIKLTPLSLS